MPQVLMRERAVSAVSLQSLAEEYAVGLARVLSAVRMLDIAFTYIGEVPFISPIFVPQLRIFLGGGES
jgi:hypothetical protein